MKFARPATSVIVGWTVVLLLIAAFVSVLLNDRWQNAQALPLMFWTLYSGLVLVAIACAIGLPSEKAAFWRTWVLTLVACLSDSGLYTYQIPELLPLPAGEESWHARLIVEDGWAYDLVSTLVAVALATVAGTLAVLLHWWQTPTMTRAFRFRIEHLFLLSTVVALSCWAITSSAEVDTSRYCTLALLFARVLAAIQLGAGGGHAVFLIGFLAGSFASKVLVNQWGLWQEWDALYELTVAHPAPNHLYFILMPLFSFYAGLFAGLLAAMLYRPPPPSLPQETQSSGA